MLHPISFKAPITPAPLRSLPTSPSVLASHLRAFAEARSPKGYSKKVKIEKKSVAIMGASFKSMGDVASKGTGGGMVSMNTHGPTKFIAPGSLTVKIEGKNVHLLSDVMSNNNSTNGGAGWNQRASLPGGSYAVDFWGSSAEDLYLATWRGDVLHSSDRGANWKKVLEARVPDHRIWGSGPNEVFVVGRHGPILHTSDHGKTWTERPSPSPDRSLRAIWGSGPRDIYLAAVEDIGSTRPLKGISILLHSADGGMTWQDAKLPTEGQISQVVGTKDSVYVVAGQDQILSRQRAKRSPP